MSVMQAFFWKKCGSNEKKIPKARKKGVKSAYGGRLTKRKGCATMKKEGRVDHADFYFDTKSRL